MSDAKRTDGPRTLVEEGTTFKGSLSSKCPIEVRGMVEGDLIAPSLAVASTGAVHGKVKVAALRSEGELAGEFDADVVRLSGTVKDNTVLRAKSLEVKLAPEKGRMQVIFGECALEIGDMPTKDASVEKPAAAADKADKGERPKTVPPPKDASASMPPPSMNGAG